MHFRSARSFLETIVTARACVRGETVHGHVPF
jgi:methyl coenzyme M reductase gamma subunit